MVGNREVVNMVGWFSEATGTFGALVENAEPGDARDGAVEQIVLGSNKQAEGMLSIGYILNLKVVQKHTRACALFSYCRAVRVTV